jgi:hypothetical protein
MAILKYINIKAPKTLNDLRIKHLKALTNEKYQKAMDLGTIIEFICLITGAKRNDLNKVNISELRKIHEHCIGLFKDFQLTKPKDEIIINGVSYLLVDPSKVGIGWHIDISNSDLQNDPSRLASLMYIEKGTTYGELDENLNMKYSNQERAKLFEEHLPLPDYLNLVSFFFATINRINEQLYGKQEDKDKTDKGGERFVWEKLIHYLSKEYNQTWEQIVKWNIFTFNHRLKFINFTKEQEIKTIQRERR